MARTFDGTDDFVGFTPRAWDAWAGISLFMLNRRNASGAFHTYYYAGANGGAVNGNVQSGIDSTNDLYLGCNGASTDFAGTVAAANQITGSSKATGTATPRADYASMPANTGWVHSNMAATLANPATTTQTIEEIGRWNGGSDFFNGDIDWLGIWGVGQLSANETEALCRLAPRFLPFMLPQCQRFYWFNQPITDSVRDMSNHMADQTSRTGTTHTNQVALMPNLAGTTFSVLPGVL